MDDFLSLLATLAAMAVIVLGFRLFIRRPRGLVLDDPPGVRTVAVFSGDDRELFRDDREDKPFVGIRLFTLLCEGLAARGVRIENRRPVEFAQGADCVVENERFGMVMERIDPYWVLSIEWVPTTGAERRHLAWTHRVYAPADTPALRRLLESLDAWLKSQPKLGNVRWHRKEKWFEDDATDPAERPIAKQ